MLNGKELGRAIADAIKKKLASGAVPSQAAIARHFGIKPPSIADWKKKGSISKDKLPELYRYFSDVVGYEHWGLTQDEWPSGLSKPNASSHAKPKETSTVHHLNRETDHDHNIREVIKMMCATDIEGRVLCAEAVRRVLKDHNKRQNDRAKKDKQRLSSI